MGVGLKDVPPWQKVQLLVSQSVTIVQMMQNYPAGISQMTFLWTVMSVFNVVANVVANINNNQNNRNNNNNNLNINKISTQNTQISANTNNANTISIMLPPPIPVLAGGRQLDSQQRLKRFVERERKIRKREAEAAHNSTQTDMKYEFSKVAFDIMQGLVNSTSGKDKNQIQMNSYKMIYFDQMRRPSLALEDTCVNSAPT